MVTKIYFSASISGGRDDAPLYQRLVDLLKEYGEVLTEHIGSPDLSSSGEDGDDHAIYARDLEWLAAADVLVAEVSTPSLGVGFEIAKALELHKPVLCLYRPEDGRRLSAMIAGCPNLTLREYRNLEEARAHLDAFFA